MPASVFRLRGALLLLFLVACRTSDNPEVCNRVDECLSGYQCNLATQRCEATGGPDVGRGDGSADGPAADRTGSDGPPADSGQDAEGACLTAANCPADKPVCAPAGRCVACMGHGDCGTDPNKPVCLDSACVACNQSQVPANACEQKNLATPRCAGTGACAECVTSRDCSQPAAPICVEGKCAPCTADSQCRERDGDDPGLCLAHLGGRCASDAEVIYVRATQPCVDVPTGLGTADMPFCNPDQALEQVRETRRILLLRGQDAFTALTVRPEFAGVAAGVISVIGQPGAAIVPGGSRVGVTVGAGDVFLRGLTIRDGAKEGVVATGEAIVRLYQCVIKLNKAGGLLVSGGAGFEVTNTIFDGNGIGLVGPTAFGGAYLGEPTAGRPSVFRFNTVVGNQSVGVACGKPMTELSSVLLTNNAEANQRNCKTTPFSQEGGEPVFDKDHPYGLTATSPCRDQGDPASYPPDDWKGEPRPGGTRADCGADEFHPQ